MLNRIKSLFEANENKGTKNLTKNSEIQLAAAALLVESASIDGLFDQIERQRISNLLETHFSLTVVETETLIKQAELALEGSRQLYGFTKAVKDRYEECDRINLIEMLWEVAFADGNVDAFEKNLIQRVAGLLFVSDKDRGLAKKRVIARLGILG